MAVECQVGREATVLQSYRALEDGYFTLPGRSHVNPDTRIHSPVLGGERPHCCQAIPQFQANSSFGTGPTGPCSRIGEDARRTQAQALTEASFARSARSA